MRLRGEYPSRRAIIAAIAAGPVTGAATTGGTPKTEPESAVLLCRRYIEIEERCEELMRRWGDLEAFLAEHHAWFKLTPAQQQALPAAHQLNAIDEELEQLARERPLIMRRLHRTPASTAEGAIGKLAVLAVEIEPDDCPSAHRMLLSAMADFEALFRQGEA